MGVEWGFQEDGTVGSAQQQELCEGVEALQIHNPGRPLGVRTIELTRLSFKNSLFKPR
jgi:hypothetical protein